MTMEPTYTIPEDRYYEADNHMWAQYDAANNQVLVGIDTLGLASLGDLAFVSLEPEGKKVQAGDSLGVIEAAKMTGDLIAPVSGTIVGRNSEIMQDPSIVNNDPYDKGWMIVLEAEDWEGEAVDLVSGEAIPGWTETEIERYRSQGWID